MAVMSFDAMLKSQGYPGTGDDIVKALATSNSNGQSTAATAHYGGPLMLENLDAVMTEVLVTEQHFKLFNLLPKVPSAQPYYEYNIHKGFGSNRAGGAGFRQGGAPKGSTSSFERKGVYNKFLGVKGGVTHQMMVTGQNGGAFEDPNVRENRDRTLELLEKVERELIFGNTLITDENGETVNFDGLLTQLTADYSANVIDKKGEALSFDDLDLAAKDLITTGKQPSVNGYTVLQSPHVLDGLNKQFTARNMVRFNKDTAINPSYGLGQNLTGYDTQFGRFGFDYSILLNEVDGDAPVSAAPAGAPTVAPTISSSAGSTGGLLPTGNYYYSVALFNDTGETIDVVDSVQAVTLGEKVTLTIGNATTSNCTGARIYRGTTSSNLQWIAKVPAVANGNLTFVDGGEWRTADTDGNLENGLAIVVKPEARDIAIAQMTPMIKMPLPQEGTTFPFLLLLYIVSVIKAPQRVKIFKNCGTYTAA